MNGARWRGSGRVRIAAAVGVMVAVVAASPAAATTTAGWPQIQGNAAHNGYEPAERSVTRQNVSQLSVAWTQPLSGEVYASEPVVSGGDVYMIAGNQVLAFDADTGAQLWQATLVGQLFSTPAVQDGLVLVAYNRGRPRHTRGVVVALNSATGATVWSHQGGAVAYLTTTATRAYVSLTSGQVEALSLSHGYKAWVSPVVPGATDGCGMSRPSVSGTFVVVDASGLVVTALSTSTGAVAWSDTLGAGECGIGPDSYLPAISGGSVYAGWFGGLAAIDLASGSVVWDNQSLSDVIDPLSVTRDAVIASPIPTPIPTSGAPPTLEAFSRTSGDVLWTATKHAWAAATFGGLAWTLSVKPAHPAQTEAVALSATSGHRIYTSAPFSGSQVFPPVVAAGHVYVNEGSALMCLALPG